MHKSIWIVTALLFLSSYGQGQVSFSVSAGPNYSLTQTKTGSFDSFRSFLQDSFIYKIPATFKYEDYFEGKMGWFVGGAIEMPLTSKVFFKTGLSLRSISFSVDFEYKGSVPKLGADTLLVGPLNPAPIEIEPECDEYTNHPGSIDLRTHYNIIYLTIPVSLQY